jgi:hypothetical protein
MTRPDPVPPGWQEMNRQPTARSVPERGLRLVPAGSPSRLAAKPLGLVIGGPRVMIGLEVADARHHVHVQGLTGTGKSTWLAGQVLAEARAGRGVALLDCQGDLARHVLARLPAAAAGRLVIVDAAETAAPPAWNVLGPLAAPGLTGQAARDRAAENVAEVFRRLYAAWWGPRMDEMLRAACLTLARRPGSTLADITTILTSAVFRRRLLAACGEPPGLEGFWDGYDQLTPAQRGQLTGPLLSRLRSVMAGQFARDLLGTPGSTFTLDAILDGGILIARLPKGEIGEHACRLTGSLLLAGCGRPPPPAPTAPPTSGPTPPSSWTRATTSCTCPSAPRTPWPRPAATGSAWSWPTSTWPSCRRRSATPSTPTPATRCSSPSPPPTRPGWPATPSPTSMRTTWPAGPGSRSPPASCTTATTPRPPPWPPCRSRRQFPAAPRTCGRRPAATPA